jgi:DNA-binding NarL/FixJ family response regulator
MAEFPGPRSDDRSPAVRTPRPRVVIVDDHDLVRRELAALLAAAGFDVVALAPTLAEGRRVLRATVPDVAVVDDGLPDGSGVEFCRELGALSPGTAVIVHAATLLPGQERRALAAGAVAAVLKSVDGAPLLQAIARCAAPARPTPSDMT